MAVVNTLGANITKLNASPVQNVDAALSGGKLRSQADVVAIAAGDDDTSTFRVARVHSSWRVAAINRRNTAITGGTSYDIGLYRTAEDGGAVVDVDAYGSAVSLASAATTPVDDSFEARSIANIQNRVYQDAGLTTDPNIFYDIVYTANTIGTVAGTLAVDVLTVVE